MKAQPYLLPVAALLGLSLSGCGMFGLSAKAKTHPPEVSSEAAPMVEEPPVFPDIVMQSQAGRVSVIMYHDVIKERDKNSVWFDCTVDEFQKDIDLIAEKGFTVLSLDQLYKHLTTGEAVPEKSVVLTFDDNYQGFYDNALPILRERKFPAAVFVHTGYVGSKQGHPKMTWYELRELQKEGLVTIGAHTVTHPVDFALQPLETQRKELVDSKAKLEKELGVEIPFMAYPLGSNDVNTQQLAKEAGYKMSFTMQPTPAEGSPNILCVGRYEAKKFATALEEQEQELMAGPVAISDLAWKNGPVSCEVGEFDGIKLAYVKGGMPTTAQADGRKSVGQFVTEGNGIAGINGTFFSAAAINSEDNKLIGPCRPGNMSAFLPDPEGFRLPKLKDRPMVIWGPSRIAIVPFQPGPMNQEPIFKAFMPDYTDAFLAGTWMVHMGMPRPKEQLTPFASKDIQDYRKRAFFGITRDGELLVGASMGSITTEDLARAAAAAGAYEAVLLDSGFSTSLVYDNMILASGHSNAEHPSRPVPHAIVIKGDKGTVNLGDLKPVSATTVQATEEEAPRPRHRRKRRR